MSGSFVLIAVVVGAVALAVVLAPLRAKQQQAATADEHSEAPSEYESTLLALRDLDFDHELGVVADDDYRRLREELVARAAQTMPRKKSGRKKSTPRPQQATAAGKKRKAEVTEDTTTQAEGFCPQCGRPHQPEHQFCGKCGARLTAA